MSASSPQAGAGLTAATQARWNSRPFASAFLRAVVFVVPVAAASLTALLLTRLLPPPTTLPAAVFWWIAFLGGAGLMLAVCARLMRRVLPLAALLKLTLVFPDEAPSRFVIAWKAGSTRELKRRVAEARLSQRDDAPIRVAERVLTLITALGAHDRLTRGHSERVRAFTDMVADELSIPSRERDKLRWGALLHDVGKLTVPEEILNKRGELDQSEWAVIHRHPLEGMRIVAPMVPWLGSWAGAIEHHHERYDGSGYPHGLAADEISLAGRIVAVADAYETMTSARAYKRPLSAPGGREELARRAGTQFDPRIVRAFLAISIGRLWRVVGLAAFLAQVPVLGAALLHGMLQRLARPAANVTGATAAIAGLAVAGVLDLPGLESSRRDPVVAQPGGPSQPRVPATPERRAGSTGDRPEGAADQEGGAAAADSEPPGDLLSAVSSGLPSVGEVSPPPDGSRAPGPAPGEDVIFVAQGRIRGPASSYWGAAGVTERDFLAECGVPGSQGVSAWVFVIPASLPPEALILRVTGSGSPALDLDVRLYSERCDLLGALRGGRRSRQGRLLSGTRFVVVTESSAIDARIRLMISAPRGS